MTEQNTATTSELLQQATAGDAKAQFELALCYINGKGVNESQALALEWHEKSAEKGYAEAQFSLGVYYFFGVDEIQTRKLISKWVSGLTGLNKLSPALALAAGQASQNGFTSGKPKLAFKCFKQATEQNHVESCYWLGMCYQNGWGTESNVELAFSCFKQSAEMSWAEAYCPLAHCYRDAIGTGGNYDLAFQWATKAVENKDIDPEAYLFLGGLYANGFGVQQNDKQAFKWYEKAAKNINEGASEQINEDTARAQYRLAHCYENVEGVEKSIELANQFYLQADEQDLVDAETQFRMANYYLYSNGVEQDYQTGMEWLIAAIQAGHSKAEQLLTDAYLSLAVPACLLGKGEDEQYYRFVFDWCMQEKSGVNEVEACFLLGILYFSGKGAGQNDQLAFKYFKQADEKFTEICSSVIYEDDENTLVSASTDLFLFLCYTQGKGVKKDLNKDNNYMCSYDLFGSVIVKGLPRFYHSRQRLKVVLITLRIELFRLAKEYDLANIFINEAFGISDDIRAFEKANGFDKSFKDIFLRSIDQEKELDIKNQELEAKNQELNNMIAMFAHNFLGTLQCIRSNAEHENNPDIHLKTVKMMSGALTAFSILSADDDKLVEQLKQDKAGESCLQQSLSNNLALAISQLLSKTNKDKIINLYLKCLRQTRQVEQDTTGEELRSNGTYRKKWQALQHHWEDEFNALFSGQVELSTLQTWITGNFFPIRIEGFNAHDIRFKEYGITDSIFLIVFMEIFVNALKYMDVTSNKPLIINLRKQEQNFQLHCENPSSQDTGRGTHKGIDFLNTIANKLNGSFSSEFTENSFKTSFIIPSKLLK